MVFQTKSEKKYALVEANIKNFQYYNAKYGQEYGDSVLKNVFQILQEFVEGRGYVSHTYADNFHFFIEYTETDDPNQSQHILSSFLLELMKKLFFNPDPILHKNIFLSFGIILPSSLHGSFEHLINKLGVIRKSCQYIKEGLEQNNPRVPLSFNITNVALLQQNSHREYLAILEEVGLPPRIH